MPRTKRKRASIRTEPPDPIPIPLVGLDHFSSLTEEKQRQYIQKSKSICIDNYLQAIEVVKKWKNLPTDEKLRRLLTPLILYNKLDPFGNPIPFVDESVDIERDLDLEKLFYDREKYDLGLTDRGHGPEENTLLSPCSPIWIREEFENELKIRERDPADSIFTMGMVSLEDLHREWLPSLNQERIKSQDLLDQILLAHAIKKAQNDDKEAIKKLYDLYVRAAEGQAVKVLKREAKRTKYPIQKEDVADIKQDVRILLRIIIGGFRPDYIMQQLLEDRGGKTMKGIPPWVKHFYIYYLGDYLPQRMENNIRETQRNQELITELGKLPGDAERNQAEIIPFLQARNRFLGFLWIGMLNPFAPFQAKTRWKTLKRFNRFNSYSFLPGLVRMGPRRNLTTWLFGYKHEITGATACPPSGKLYQLLRDKWRPLLEEKSKSKNFDFGDDFGEDHEDHKETIEDRKKALGIEDLGAEENKLIDEITVEKKVKRLRKGLLDLGAPARNLEIYFRWKSDDRQTQSEIAKEYGLSLRQIGRICQQISRLLPKAKRLFLEE